MNVSLMWLLDGIAPIPASSVSVTDLTLDSREARAGGLFLALPGGKTHGLKFAAEAAARGVGAVLWEPGENVEPPKLPASVFTAAVPGLHKLVGRIADRFFSWPSSHMTVVGITGTNGKTTCAYLLAQCLERLGIEAAYAGTLGWGRIAALERPTHTTPDAVTVHRELAQLKSMGVRNVAMEVSSHALDQDRIAGVRLHSAAFTNLSRDHLDYHASMQAYGEAKLRLFAIEGLQHAVINIGDEFGRNFAQSYAGRAPLTAVWIGAGEFAWLAERTVYARGVTVDLHGISLQIGRSAYQAAGPVQCREHGGGARLSHGLRRTASRRGKCIIAVLGGSRTHGGHRNRRAQQASGRHRLRSHTGRAGQGLGRIARALQRCTVVRVRLRRGPRPGQAPDHGRHRRRACR